ncbi:SDR family NAD(P)-dependent oxidoreductase [Poritiphilus flavus]|uniref:SDR family oxidoreductase n=1 Tax=Poritiphilus flavus TaxID=2697053 RepID=A0A6L9EF03_9FLAO|nr:SDR family oxidoreductase [Poritiphilus flavus]NAS13251.1 SDR family oxidoreductase [Poritiphilus flavus]
MDEKLLQGQRILVTGASRGIGKAISTYLLDRGAQVGVHYNQSKDAVSEITRTYPLANVLRADLENAEEVLGLFENALESMGGIDSLVLNAGIFEPHFPDLSDEDWLAIWRKTIAVNLESAAILTKKAIEHFKSVGGGRLIYIGSRAAFRGETEEYLAYAASKGGLTSLARSVARSFGKYNITAFVLAPGFTRTAMAEKFIQQHGEQKILDEISLPRLTIPEDIAPLAALICSGKMDHATGTTIDMNAGSYIH